MNVAVDHQHIFQKRNRLRQLRAFCRVAEMGSITKASEALHLTQSLVSLDVRHLEREFETALFDRTKRKIGLSPAGERLYKLAEPLVRRMDALSAISVEEIGDVVSRRIHFGATQAVAAFVLPKYLRRFQKRYPEMRLRVSVCRVRDGVKRIRDDDLEFLFGADATSLMNEDDMVYHHAAWYDHVLITAPDHPLAGRESVSLEEASTYPAVLPSPDMDPQRSEESDSRHFGVDWKRRNRGRSMECAQALRRARPRNIRRSQRLSRRGRCVVGHSSHRPLPGAELWGDRASRKVPDAGHQLPHPPHGSGLS